MRQRFASHPGRLDTFAWPVTRAQALQALQSFIDERLPQFGRWQDATVAGRALAVPRPPLGGAEPEAAEPARGDGRRRSKPMTSGHAPLASGGRLHPPDPGLARIRARHLLDDRCRATANATRSTRSSTCPTGSGPAPPTCLPARRHHADAGAWLRAPHPAADGHRPVRAAAGRAAAAGARLVPGGVRRCGGMGGTAQQPGHEPVRRRRPDGQQALHRHRQVHPAHEPRTAPAAATTRPSAAATRPAPSPRCTGTS